MSNNQFNLKLKLLGKISRHDLYYSLIITNITKIIHLLSTGWYNHGNRCLNFINIHGNGKMVKAMVVDE